jgi:hypothetical protein
MSAADRAIENAAEKLERLVEQGRRAGGVQAKVAEMFADDPAFVRKLKPSLIAARARGEQPTDEEPAADRPEHEPAPAVAPAPRRRPRPKRRSGGSGGGPSPFVVVGAAFAAGLMLAHLLDWLGHRYPRHY